MLRRVDPSRFDADGAADADAGVFGLPYAESECTVVLIPAPWEGTVSYGTGTSRGPDAILGASGHLDLINPELAALGLARPWRFGIHMRPIDNDVRAWNDEAVGSAQQVRALGPKVDDWVEAQVAGVLEAGALPGLIGGEHSVALGSIAACARAYPGLGILQVDAHADLRDAYEGYERSHASVMRNVLERVGDVASLVQVGIRDLSEAEYRRCQYEPKIHTFFDWEIRALQHTGWTWSENLDVIVERLPDEVYVSFDIDGLDPSLCPRTGTPVPGGLRFDEATSLLTRVAESGKRIVGFDVCEVGNAEWDGNVGARVVYHLAGAAMHSLGARDEL